MDYFTPDRQISVAALGNAANSANQVTFNIGVSLDDLCDFDTDDLHRFTDECIASEYANLEEITYRAIGVADELIILAVTADLTATFEAIDAATASAAEVAAATSDTAAHAAHAARVAAFRHELEANDYDAESLTELIYELKSTEGARLNDAGMTAQLAYLLAHDHDEAFIRNQLGLSNTH